jgi:hypothetical protein
MEHIRDIWGYKDHFRLPRSNPRSVFSDAIRDSTSTLEKAFNESIQLDAIMEDGHTGWNSESKSETAASLAKDKEIHVRHKFSWPLTPEGIIDLILCNAQRRIQEGWEKGMLLSSQLEQEVMNSAGQDAKQSAGESDRKRPAGDFSVPSSNKAAHG